MPGTEESAEAILRTNRDLIPSPYGSVAATEASGSIAVPLLAGFALTIATIVITSPDKFRWKDLTILFLVIAVVLFIGCLQAAQWARAYQVAPREAAAWWPGATQPQLGALETELRQHHSSRVTWVHRQQRTYRGGILALLLGLTSALVPPGAADQVSLLRWAAVGVAALGSFAEFSWITLAWLANKPEGNRTSGVKAGIRRASRSLLAMPK
jgi:hypothetical protein